MKKAKIIKKQTVQLREFISPDLALRSSANRLFDYIEALPKKSITLDFYKIRTMTRSFAHQYLMRKAKTKVRITEINVSEAVKEMFEIAKKPVQQYETTPSTQIIPSIPLGANSLCRL